MRTPPIETIDGPDVRSRSAVVAEDGTVWLCQMTVHDFNEWIRAEVGVYKWDGAFWSMMEVTVDNGSDCESHPNHGLDDDAILAIAEREWDEACRDPEAWTAKAAVIEVL